MVVVGVVNKKIRGVLQPCVYRVKISLEDAPYHIWRRVQLDGRRTLQNFMQMVLVAMGWKLSHLMVLTVDNVEYGVHMEDFADFDAVTIHEAKEFAIQEVLHPKSQGMLLYDFGDSWKHRVEIEEVRSCAAEDPVLEKVPCCVEGNGACPPENCGGIYGFECMLRLFKNPNYDRQSYEGFVAWLGAKTFDTTAFNSASTTEQMRDLDWIFKREQKALK